VLKDLAANDPAAFAALQDDLREIVPAFGRFRFGKEFVRDPRGDGAVSGVSLWMVTKSGGPVPLLAVSDGTRMAMALLAAIHNRDMPSLVLMDDIDHGLHLSAQYEVIAAIRRVMARRPELQVVCTTHSPVLLDSFDKKEVRVMALGPDGLARIQPLSAHPPVDGYRAGFSSGELWANLGEDWVANG
jgi:predicted ATPase